MCSKKKLVPGGILEPVTGRSFIFFGTSHKTSDFIVDGLWLWWEESKQELCDLKQLVINVDNGPECSGRRTQFLLRLTEFADMTGLCIRIIYYPPYHSKYNGIERYWAGLEKSWNGYLLDTVETVIKRAGNFFWKGLRTVTRLLDAPYEKGDKVCGDEKIDLENRVHRSPALKWWDISMVSYTETLYPNWLSSCAALNPAIPAPKIITDSIFLPPENPISPALGWWPAQ
jgi:hypothetical protein